MKQQKSHIDRWGFLRKWQIWENGELSKNPSKFGKTSIQVTKRGILTKGDYNKKMANLGEKRQISAKMASAPKIHQGFGQIFKWDEERGVLIVGDF